MTPKEAFEKLQEILLVTFNLDGFDDELDVIRKAITELDLYKEMSDIYRRNYQVQMCLGDRLRLIEIEKELGL